MVCAIWQSIWYSDLKCEIQPIQGSSPLCRDNFGPISREPGGSLSVDAGMPYLFWMSIILGGLLLSGVLFLAGCCCASWWNDDERPKARHKSGRLGHREKLINTDLLEYDPGGTFAFYVSKGGTKVHITDRCHGLGSAHDRGTVQRKDVCTICFNKLIKTQ